MEDIKILEEFIEAYRIAEEVLDGDIIQAIENLIARYKEVEEDIKYISEEKWKADEAVIFLTERLENALKDRIPKSKVKEKKKELDDEDLEIYDTDSEDVIISKYEDRAVLDFCNSLLED